MANLAIKGHPTRGKEVIEILEILGGSNTFGHDGNNPLAMYYIDEINKNYIICSGAKKVCDCVIFTLEEFLEKFPYKVGDKVSSKYLKNYKIEKIEWEDTNNRVIYKLHEMGWYNAKELQPYKEETMEHFKNNEETKLNIPESMKQTTEAAENLIASDDVQGSFIMSEEQLKKQERRIIFQNDAPDKTELVLGDDYEIKVEDGKTFVVRKKPQYPKTLNECCEIVGSFVFGELEYKLTNGHEYDYDSEMLWSLDRFRKLLICRDAYWKIAGEQMGLGKPWKPRWNDNYQKKWLINFYQDEINLTTGPNVHFVLVFPTKEMRDAFYENFKELIESFKELL